MPRRPRWLSVLELIRLPNTFTAAADVLAGAALFGRSPFDPVVLVAALGSMALYGGGIALNDALDVEKDREEAPGRVLPRGALSRRTAVLVGVLLLAGGLGTALGGGTAHLLVTLGLILAILAYDVWPEGLAFGAPLLMGTCRALNLARGASLGLEGEIGFTPHLAVAAHFLMVVGITVVSRFEGRPVRGKGFRLAVFALAATYAVPVLVALEQGTSLFGLPALLPVALLASFLAAVVASPGLLPEPRPIQVVLRAVFALALYDALLVLAAGELLGALLVAALFPAARLVAKGIGQRGS